MNRRDLLAACLIAACLSAGVAGAPAPLPRAQAGQSGALDLLFEQGKRLFDQFNYDEAVKIFNQLINSMTAAGQGTERRMTQLPVPLLRTNVKPARSKRARVPL